MAKEHLLGVRMTPQEKERLQDIANMAFDGNVSEAVRWFINSFSFATAKKDVLRWRRAKLEEELQRLTSMDT